MNESFDIRITGEFEEICGTWLLQATNGERVARISLPLRSRFWDSCPLNVNDAIHDLIFELRASGPKSAGEVKQ